MLRLMQLLGAIVPAIGKLSGFVTVYDYSLSHGDVCRAIVTSSMRS